MECKVKVVWLEREILNHISATILSILRDQVIIFPMKVVLWTGFSLIFRNKTLSQDDNGCGDLENVWMVLYSAAATNSYR
jgi:hypothetical protein